MAQIPVLQLPVKIWLFISRITWMAGINRGEKISCKDRLEKLNVFTDVLVKYVHRNGLAVVVAHGMLNRELVKNLKAHGWEFCENGKEGHGNLSVKCFENY